MIKMVKCPKCGEEIPFEEYETHWDQCKGETRDIKLFDGTTRNVTLDELKVILRHDDPIISVDVIEAVWDNVPNLEEILKQYREGTLPKAENPEREAEERALTKVLVGKLLTPFQEMQEENAKKLGFESLKDYEIHKEVVFANENTFEGVIIYPLDQVQLIGDFSYAIEYPEAMPPGMSDPVDWGLSNYLPIISENGVFVGYADKKPEYRQDRFPSGVYTKDYAALKKLLTENGWVYAGNTWAREA
uniref:Uncharacterized protein n=1 Tax=viral metagenome TaxID=1070528 RepID=A0A6M3M4Z8_9ZZZZ